MSDIDILERELAAALIEINRLKRAIELYAQHKKDCDVWQSGRKTTARSGIVYEQTYYCSCWREPLPDEMNPLAGTRMVR